VINQKEDLILLSTTEKKFF